MQGKRTLVGQDLIEVVDLYVWGARMADMAMLYGVHKTTIRENVKRAGVPMRGPSRPLRRRVKSTPPMKREGALRIVDFLGPDQLLRSSARVQQDKRTAQRRVDESRRFYQEAASECRYAFLRSDSRLPDLE